MSTISRWTNQHPDAQLCILMVSDITCRETRRSSGDRTTPSLLAKSMTDMDRLRPHADLTALLHDKHIKGCNASIFRMNPRVATHGVGTTRLLAPFLFCWRPGGET